MREPDLSSVVDAASSTAWRRLAGLWGPAAFATAAAVAARRQVGYSHVDHHVSGLASQGEQSASVMVPGFLVLAASQAAMSAPSRDLRRMLRFASITSLVAGLARVSAPECPRPGIDAHATRGDAAHAAASIATFFTWAALPAVATRSTTGPAWYRGLARRMVPPTVASLLLAAVTTNLDARAKGLAQRGFLALVFAFLAATGLAAGPEPMDP